MGQKGVGCLGSPPMAECLLRGRFLQLTWRIETARHEPVRGDGKIVRSIAVAPNRQLLAAAGPSVAPLLAPRKGKWVSTGVRVESQIKTVHDRYSPDGSTLALAGLDNRVILWPMSDELDDCAVN